MPMTAKGIVVLACATSALASSGCGDNQEPEKADAFWQQIHDQGYESFARAPGYEQRRQSNAPHGDEVDIYVNATVKAAYDQGPPLSAWPLGSLVVKNGFDDAGDLELVAAMEKRDDGWFWAEWDAEGSAKYSGQPELCTGCHASGADSVRAFGFPQ
jgi:hypothetical protein